MRLYISMFLFFPWRDGFTSVWNVLTEKQMAERSKYNFAHVLNGVVFYKVPFAQKAVLHSLYRLAKNIFKKSSFRYISSFWNIRDNQYLHTTFSSYCFNRASWLSRLYLNQISSVRIFQGI